MQSPTTGSNDARKKRLIIRQFRRRFLKVKPAGIANTVLSVVIVDRIDVQFQDLLFGKMFLQIGSIKQLQNLALYPFFKTEVQIFGQLLCDRASIQSSSFLREL